MVRRPHQYMSKQERDRWYEQMARLHELRRQEEQLRRDQARLERGRYVDPQKVQ